MDKFSFVMPMVVNHRTVEDDDLERIIKIQLPTFDKFLDLNSLDKFYVVSRAQDLELIKSKLNEKYSHFPFEFIDERELVPQIETFPLHQKTPHPGWIIQQLIKFELAKHIKTKYFMTFETDLFLTKPFSYQDIFNNDKLICSHFKKWDDTEWGRTPSCEPWYTYAVALIYGDVEYLHLNQDNKNIIDGDTLKLNKIMGVSPQFLIKDEIINMISYLEDKYQTNYIDLLLNTTNGHPNTWTEYSLYWIWLHKIGKIDDYYSFDEPYICYNELFTFNYRQGYAKKYFDEFDELIMENKQHYFNIVQSNILEIKLDDVVKKLTKHLEK